ncbi:MAG: hypothetical protein R3B06_14875, partial [Kofleriaceae bacterium]
LDRDEVPVEFLGRRLLAPPPAPTQQLLGGAGAGSSLGLGVFQARVLHLKRVLIGGLVFAAVCGLGYAARGAWYRSGAAWGVFASALIAAAAVYLWRWAATAGRPRARQWLWGVPVGLVACALAFAGGAPARDHARASIRAGHLAAAEAELDALGGEDAAGLGELYADLRLAKVQAQTNSGTARALLEQMPGDGPQRRVADAHTDQLLLEEATRFLGNHRLDLAQTTLGQMSEAGRSSPPALALAAQLDVALGLECAAREEWTCAIDRAARVRPRDPTSADKLVARVTAGLRDAVDRGASRARAAASAADRLASLTTAEAALRALEQVQHRAGPSPELVALRAQLAKAARQAAADEARAAKRRRADEAREAREEERRARAEERQSRRSCCKFCSRGCPCGDSCISCSRTCNLGPGCAC